ncbi:DNA polymerase III subunit chi [Corallincola luteus]|uniref:DNA polymerase III subunit chi n=1 Tax=Corallincola luteus TaxID=1775177 RepID=A0ABY2ANZ5_9GAMM|nr:DNA polymerase III subunit chi [Corallincola luteus]TCI04919.1 DNA polymerase III subunit chi [Corallincola luteus]
MTQVVFYLLPEDPQAPSAPALLLSACRLAERCYLDKEKVYILAADRAQAEAVDELLFGFDPDSFVPHNLAGEGPAGGAPVEIGCDAPKGQRTVLINLCPQMPSFAVKSRLIIDFVPADATNKQLARERYKQYRTAGLAIDTYDLAAPNSASS